MCVCVCLFRRRSTELAVLASRPVVGSSKKRTGGSMISSIPILVLFLSPPEIPRMSCVPTCRKTERVQSKSCRLSHLLYIVFLCVNKKKDIFIYLHSIFPYIFLGKCTPYLFCCPLALGFATSSKGVFQFSKNLRVRTGGA